MRIGTDAAIVLCCTAAILPGCGRQPESSATWASLGILESHRPAAVSIACSQDGRFLATAHFPARPYGATQPQQFGLPPASIWIWDRQEEAAVSLFRVTGLTYHSIQFTADSTQLLAPGEHGLTVWRADSATVSHLEMPTPAIISADGRLGARRGEAEGTVVLLDLETQAIHRTLQIADAAQSPEAFSGDSRTLASLVEEHHANKQIVVWDTETGRIRSRIPCPIPAKSRSFFCLSSNGRLLAVADCDSPLLTILECSSGAIVTRLDMGSSDFWSVAFSANNRLIAACGQAADEKAGLARVWDLSSQSEICTISEPSTWGITSIGFSPDGGTLITGDSNGTVRLWKVPLHASARYASD